MNAKPIPSRRAQYPANQRPHRQFVPLLVAATVSLWGLLNAPLVAAKGVEDGGKRFCSQTAALLFRACGYEAQDDYLVATAKCTNIGDSAERSKCLDAARGGRREKTDLCREQRAGRRQACRDLGENRYEPGFAPDQFDPPKSPSKPNPYFPLTVGNTWEYRSATERNTLEVLDATKLVDGVQCIVLRDQVFRDGSLAEDTNDWFAHATDGNTWYCGEEVKNFEIFDGDDPATPELVSIDGSFKAGREHDKPGLIFPANPVVGQFYLEEFSLGNAEDVTEILSTTYAYGQDAELDQLVPQELVKLLCSGDCVVTKNYSLLEPGVSAHKYYARGIGAFLEVDLDSKEVLRLTQCNFDDRCGSLPKP